MQKQRFKAKKEKVITLQEAWDVISSHLNTLDDGGDAHCFFINSNEGKHGGIVISTARSRIIVESTKKY